MNPKSQPGSGVNGALWLIAFSLFTIAICMVFLVIDKKFGLAGDQQRLEATLNNAAVQSRPERFRVGTPEPARKRDAFTDLAPPAGEATGAAASGAEADGSAGFLPTRMQPTPGSYLTALPPLIGRPKYRTCVKGKVTLKGSPPPERERPVPADYPCERPD